MHPYCRMNVIGHFKTIDCNTDCFDDDDYDYDYYISVYF